MLFSGCWAVSVEPPVCAWKRRASARSVRHPEPLAQQLRPQPPRRPELRHLLEEVVVRVEEEGKPLAELVRRQPGLDGRPAVGKAVGEREADLLDGGRAGLADVVAADRDHVPARQPLRAVGEQVGGQPHGRPRREDVVPAGGVLLEDVVLHRAAEPLARHALPLGDQLVEQEQERCRRVDRHRRRDLAERDGVEEELHVGERVDRDPGPPHLPGRARVVGVEPELRRQVERGREPGLAPLEQVAEARVRLLGRAEAGVLADRPRPPAVHRRVRPAGVRKLAGQLRYEPGDVVRRVDGGDLDPGVGLAPVLTHGHAPIVRRRSLAQGRGASSASRLTSSA